MHRLPEPTASPFQAGRRLNAAELVDRREEVAAVRRAMLEAGKLFVIGPRRHGKTSLIHVAAQEAAERGVVVLSFDAEAYPSAELLAAHMLAEATRRLEPAVERAQGAVSRFFARLRPSITYNPADGSFSATLGVDATEAGGIVPLLAEVLDGIEGWAAQAGRRTVVVIDEVQELLEREGEVAERQLRAAVQRHEHVGYVFAGSRTHYLRRLTSDPAAAFFNLGSRLYVGPMPDDEVRAWLRDAFAAGGRELDAAAADAILEIADRVPYNVQLLADACWRAAGSSPSHLSAEDVRAIAVDWIRTQDPIYTPQWLALTAAQRIALQAVVHESAAGLTSRAVQRKYSITASGMQRALAGLADKGVLYDEERAGQSRLRLQDPFFGLWVRVFTVAPG